MNTVFKKNKLVVCVLVLVLMIMGTLGVLFSQTQTAYAESSADYPNLKFTLYTNNGKTEYKVTALKRDLTIADIPAYIEVGEEKIPVTEIADNSFTNCLQLVSVEIPGTVTRIGNNAFSGCTSLERIVGMSNVTILGNNVFRNCTAIKDLILPPNLVYMGTGNLTNVQNDIISRRSDSEMRALNPNYDAGRAATSKMVFGNTLVYDDVVVNGVQGYEVRIYQNLAPEEDFIIYSSGKKDAGQADFKPIFNIQRQAFENCTFGSVTIKHDAALPFNHLMNISSYAFTNVTADSINIQVGITLNDSTENNPTYLNGEQGTSVGIFEWASVNTVTLPTNAEFSRIPRTMFAFCTVSTIKSTDTTLAPNHISTNIKRIDTSAFEGATCLKNIYIPSSITTMGESVFSGWGDGWMHDKQTITINLPAAPSGWAAYWNSGITYGNTEVIFDDTKATYTVTLNKQDGTDGTNSVEAEYDMAMPSAIAPTRTNYEFQGYFSGEKGTGFKYYNADMTSARNWDKKGGGTLYAHWTGVKSTVTFDKQDGTGGTNNVTAEYGKFMPDATKPNRDNCIFQGYFSEKDGKGTKYYDKDMISAKDWDKTSDTDLFAYWKGVESTVTFNKQGGDETGTNSVTAEYGKAMPEATASKRENYVFKGYFTEPKGEGDKYYNADMTSAKDWDKTADTTLYAYWTGEESNVTFDKKGGTGGTDSIIAEFGKPMPNATKPSREGHEFKGYRDVN